MKKKLIFIVMLLMIILPTKVFAGIADIKNLAGVDYHEYVPANANSNTPVIVAVHGIGSSQNDIKNFAPYSKIADGSYAPNAIVIIPRKNYRGAWNGTTIANFVKAYQQAGHNGSYTYYGFSEGVYDASNIISSTGFFKSAVLVDGKGINASKLAGLQNVYLYCGCDCYNAQQITGINNTLTASGTNFTHDTRYKLTSCGAGHGLMDDKTYVEGFNYLLNNTPPSTNPNPQPVTETPTNTQATGGQTQSQTNSSGGGSSTPATAPNTTSPPLSTVATTTRPIGVTTTFFNRRTTTTTKAEIKNVGENFCEETSVKKTLRMVGWFLFIAKLAIPIIIIVTGSIDIAKAATAKDNSALLQKVKLVGFRILIGLAVFFLPTIIDAILSMTGAYETDNSECMTCLLEPSDCET